MKVAFYMNCVSAHQLPLAKEVAELVGAENSCYVDAGEKGQEYQSCHDTTGIQVKMKGDGEQWMEESDLLLTGMRDLELFERRAEKGLRTYYTSERWFKPQTLFDLRLFDCLISVAMPGWVRMLVPEYRRMVKRFVKWANGDDGARVLAIGPWAKKDFLRLGVRAEKIVDWGYFVERGTGGREQGLGSDLRILWCGRMLGLKRVETFIRAVKKVKSEGEQRRVSLTIVGDGPGKTKLIKLAQRLFPGDVVIEHPNNLNNPNNQTVAFLPSQPMEKVRKLMRKHDLFVFGSNGYEGWGAVVSEALEEGMNVIGTFEAGASATLLPRERLYRSGDWRALAGLIVKEIRGELPPCGIGEWTAKLGAKRLLEI